MEKHEIRNLVRGGQVTLPKWFRDKYHLYEGDPIEFVAEEGRLVIKPIKNLEKVNAVRKLIKFLDETESPYEVIEETDLLDQVKEEIKIVRKSIKENK